MTTPAAWFRAPAKVNLGLAVLGRRPDGFHELDGVMSCIALADELAVEELAEAGDARDRLELIAGPPGRPVAPAGTATDPLALPLDAGNLVVRAARAYRDAALAHGAALPSLRWRLRKRVPIAAGLGGGSSDAAAALRLLAARYPLGLDVLALAAGIGSDVPFFATGSTAARARGRGERLLPVDLPPASLVLINPGVGVRAQDAFAWWRPGRRGPASPSVAWWAGPPLTNDLDPGVAARVPAVAATLAALRDAWDGPVTMSGSGATCFALAPDAAAAASLAATLRERLPATTWIEVSALARGA
jgi:4-diphosphocytidyl-2-C-methyl-D-erythritol kinase